MVHVETTPATTPDFAVSGAIHQALAAKGVLPATHLVDAGYVDGAHLAASRQDYAIDLIGPAPADHSWQFQAGQGFATADFALDWAAQQATCPQGHTSVRWSPPHNAQGTTVINIRFPRTACAACPCRPDCTRSSRGARELTVRPQADHEA
ncbi:MAG: transposase [Rhizobium sp.]|nr:transposase [Rhizobium sp.]